MILQNMDDGGIFIVDSNKLSQDSVATIHEWASKFMNSNQPLPMDGNRPVAGLGYENGELKPNSNIFNKQEASRDSVRRYEVDGDVVKIIRQLCDCVEGSWLEYINIFLSTMFNSSQNSYKS